MAKAPPAAGPAAAWLPNASLRIIATGVVLALLYAGRNVLIPLTLAIMLSFLLAPVASMLRRAGAGRVFSVLVTVLAFATICCAAAAAIGMQVLRVAESLPQYEENIHQKLKTFDEAAKGWLSPLWAESNRLIAAADAPVAPAARAGRAQRVEPARPPAPMVLEAPQPPPRPLQMVGRLLKPAWGPLQATGIVLLVLVFLLLEHESVRDRFFRLAGTTDIRSTTLALDDAGERLSRFFVSQVAVNAAFAVAVWLSLRLLGLPQAMLLAALAGAMRFLPYVGVAIAALCSSALAFAIDPGWWLAAATLCVFFLFDIVLGQLLEPHLYGHATGLSPLAVVIGAIFWSALWGPVGLVLSTPLTLCMVVAGRHIKALSVLELLLSDAQALTLPQRFYQRALAGDSNEILANARAFLKKHSLAAYCDRVLLPALDLAHRDGGADAADKDRRATMRAVMIDVVSRLSHDGTRSTQSPPTPSVLDEMTAADWLRRQREQATGKWQGPLGVPAGSVVLCLGIGSAVDDLAAELLARLLLLQNIDARHFTLEETDAGLPTGADPAGISIVYLVSAFPSPEREQADLLREKISKLVPNADCVSLFFPGVEPAAQTDDGSGNAGRTATSFAEALELCKAFQASPQKEGEPEETATASP